MTTNLKARLLQHFLKKKSEGGFTLIELLVVIIIIGILSAIALPSFLNQANRARESEAATYVGTVNRGQQAYRLEFPTFAPTLDDLEVGISTTTDYYTYAIVGTPTSTQADITATPLGGDAVLKGYRGCATAEAATGKTTAVLKKATSGGAANVPANCN
jgi:type IV pilus assembly protein PilA